MDEYMQMLQGLDPQTLDQIINAGLMPQRMGAMSGQESAQGRTVGSGPFSAYIAASPLEHLANALRGVYDQRAIGKIGQGRKSYLQNIIGNAQRQMGTGAPQDTIGYGMQDQG